MLAGFTEEQIKRYARHIILPEVGGEGQKKLLDSKVLCVGAGGLGSPIIQYLAAAGVGTIGIIDDDVVDISNLQRQTIHAGNLGKNKAVSAGEFVKKLNPDIEVVIYTERISADNVRELVKEYDMIADGTDNFPTRYLINDACVLENKPFSHGSIFRFEGQIMTIIPNDGPCYRCIFEHAPPEGMVPSCQEAGVFGVLPGIVGSIQATEIIKHLLGIGEILKGRMLYVDALNMDFFEIKVRKNPECPVCGKRVIDDIYPENYTESCRLW